ncbi:MAG: helix-turn-helix transcriptional regulator [Pseudanabaenaceae cyanobacterium bins.39]|nr:helix-turn-helix transcriptional regulator [Pseudanabaenaceae cyanobacterium bins.39]
MTIESFVKMTIADISRRTGISVAQWSRYFNKKKTINESTLEQAGAKLGMTSDEVLKAINIRRELLTYQSRDNKLLTK